MISHKIGSLSFIYFLKCKVQTLHAVATCPKRQNKILRNTLSFSFLPWSTSKSNANVESKLTVTPTILETADNIFENGKYEDCLIFLTNSKDLDNIEVKWRICRAMYNMAKEDKYDTSYKNKLILQAHKIIEAELKSHSNNYYVQKWYALTLDAKSSNEGYKKKLEHLEIVKNHLELAVKLNPTDACLLHMLGEMCYQVTEIPWLQRITIELLFTKLPNYSCEEALEYFLKAEKVQPRFYSLNLLRLGCCYLKINKTDQAKYYLKLAASYPVKSNDDHQAKRDAAEILKKLK